MIRLLIQNWWLLLVRGVLAVAFAAFIFLFLPLAPAPLLRQFAFAGLVAVFSIFAMMTGIITMAAALRGPAWPLLSDGAVVAAGGLVILLSPALTLDHIVRLIAVTALLAGIVEIAAAIRLRQGPPERAGVARSGVGRHIADEWLLFSAGVISLAFATSLLLTRAETTQTVLTWTGLYAFASGLAMAGFALRLRGLKKSIHALASPFPPAKAKEQRAG